MDTISPFKPALPQDTALVSPTTSPPTWLGFSYHPVSYGQEL